MFAYRRHDDDQELLSLELFHWAHFDVREANFTQQHPDLLTLKTAMWKQEHFRICSMKRWTSTILKAI